MPTPNNPFDTEGQNLLDILDGKKPPQPAQAAAPAASPTKNFKTPADVPDYFSNETGAAVNQGAPNQDPDLGTFNPRSGGKPAKTKPGVQPEATPVAAHPDAAPTPGPAPDPTTAQWNDLYRKLDGDDGHANTVNRYPAVANESALDGISHFFRVAPQSLARGVADSLGFASAVAQGGPLGLALRATMDTVSNYYKHSPSAAFMKESPGAALADLATKGVQAGMETGMGMLQDADNSSKGIRKLAGKVGINTNLPSEEGDYSNSARWSEALNYSVGSAAPFMPVGAAGAAVNAIGRGAMPVVMAGLRSGLKDAGLALSSGGLGREMGDVLGGGPHTTSDALATAGGQIGGAVAGIAGLKAGGALAASMTAARALMVGGVHASERAGSPMVNNLIKGQFNAAEMMQQIADDPAKAAANARAFTTMDLPGGFEVPPPTASMDVPTQALMHQVVNKDDFANRQYRSILENNENLLKGMASKPGEEGVADATSHLYNLQQQRIGSKEKLVQQALDQADFDLGVATRGATFDLSESGELRRAYETNIRNQLYSAWSEANATTRAEFQSAKFAGLTDAQVPTTRLFDRMADMMSESIKTGNQDRFPQGVISQFYDKPPLKMFDQHGNPIGNITENYLMGSTTPWERLQGFYNNIDFEIMKTLKGSNPDTVKLQYLHRMQDEALVSMKDLRMGGGQFAPGSLPKALQNAINSAQENRQIFVDSPVGSLLGFNKGVSLPDNVTGIRRWLANTPQTSERVQSLFDAVGQRSLIGGVHPADELFQNMQGMLRQEFADTYRGSGLAGTRRWLQNNDALLSHDAFTDLKNEFHIASNSREVAERMVPQGKIDLDEIRHSRAAMFLNNNPETALKGVLSGPNKFSATQELIGDLQQDPTGRALQGFANFAFDRMVAEASNYTVGLEPGRAFSGAAAEKFHREYEPMFRALSREITGYGDRVSQFVQGTKMMDRIQHRPNVPLSEKEIAFSLTGMGGIASRIIGARVGAAMGTGTIQVPGYMAGFADKIFKTFTSSLPAERAQALLSRAMVEKDTFDLLMTPIKDTETAHRLSVLLEPYLLSAPSNTYNTYQQKANPQPPMMDKEPPT